MTADTVEKYYRRLFTETPYWSTPFPNPDEAARWGKICLFLSRITHLSDQDVLKGLRILDIGCGRGWLTRLASVYGSCDGIDPVADSIAAAKTHFPDLSFRVGTATDVVGRPDFVPYDVVVASEVIEHVRDREKERFVKELRQCLRPWGHVIVTTPRAEVFKKWRRLCSELQPIEEWVSQKELKALFARYGFSVRERTRAYVDLPGMSFLNRCCVSKKVKKMLYSTGLSWGVPAMEHEASLYRVWWFQRQS